MARILAGKISDITPGKMTKITADGKEILVANIDGSYHAIDDTCTHSGASLSEGSLEGCTVKCGWHGAEFDCKTGKMSKFPAKIRDLTQYSTIIESDSIFLDL
ncbi:MAG: non-heme iron oxygenase ferredoxin subunit [Nitrosopumilus sp. D6]|nr:MAG: non-heme iron oxygenase ferredoxin subunit [Nitrosopumilus sp. D6]